MSSTTNWTLSGSPRIACAIVWTMSMSEPRSSPVCGSRYPARYLPWSTPAISRPRSAILAIVVPAGMAPGAGSGPSGRRLSRTSVHAGRCVGPVVEVPGTTAGAGPASGPPGSSIAPSASTPATHR